MCSWPSGQERTLFRLANIHGLARRDMAVQPGQTANRGSGIAAPAAATANPASATRTPGRIQWARNRGMAVNGGPCTSLEYDTVQSGKHWTLLARRFNLTAGESDLCAQLAAVG